MEILNIFELSEPKEPCALALGIFDGVHIGHKALLSKAAAEAQKQGLLAAVFSIDDGAAYKKTKSLLPDKEKYAKMEACGIKRVYTAHFSQICSLTAKEFVKEVLFKRLNCKIALCGENFRFGKMAAGDAHTLKKEMQASGGKAVICESVLFEGDAVSASRIKEALAEGKAELAEQMLGEPFALRSFVLHGKGIGGPTLGVPTVNLAFDEAAFVPKHGVYVSKTKIGNQVFGSITNIGIRPTFENDGKVNAETHIFAKAGDLYGKEISVSLLAFLRGEHRFEDPHALKAQLEKDCASALTYLASHNIT